jgi:hypothetical protein
MSMNRRLDQVFKQADLDDLLFARKFHGIRRFVLWSFFPICSSTDRRKHIHAGILIGRAFQGIVHRDTEELELRVNEGPTIKLFLYSNYKETL